MGEQPDLLSEVGNEESYGRIGRDEWVRWVVQGRGFQQARLMERLLQRIVWVSCRCWSVGLTYPPLWTRVTAASEWPIGHLGLRSPVFSSRRAGKLLALVR